MCEPVSITLATVAIVGGGLAAYGQYTSGQAAKKAGDEQARLNTIRASMAEKQGMIAQVQSDKEYAQRVGHGRTATASGGVLLEGRAGSSYSDWAIGSAEEHAAEKAMIGQNAAMAAWGFESQANLDRYGGRMAARAGTYNAWGTGLSALASAGATGMNAAGGSGAAGSYKGGNYAGSKAYGSTSPSMLA
jgi:hypothetical protein